MQVAQSGIFALGTGSHVYLEFDLLASADPGALVRATANLREPRTTTGGVNLVLCLSFSPAAIVQGLGQQLAMETLALGLHLLPAGIDRVQPLLGLFLPLFQQRI